MGAVPFMGAATTALWRERKWTAEQHEALQRQRFAHILRFAQNNTALGRERYAGLDPDTVRYEDVPPVTKVELMENFDASLSVPDLNLERVRAFTADRSRAGELLDGKFLCATTSGTTGRVGIFVTDAPAWARLNGGLLARTLRHRLVPHEVVRFMYGRRYRMAMAIATEGHFITRLVSDFSPWASHLITQMRTFSIVDHLDKTVAGLNRYRPHYLHAYPTFAEVLAKEQIEGRLQIDPEFISLGSEAVSAFARQLLSRAFPNAEISVTYGATECLTMANQCSQGKLHLNTDLCLVEAIGEDGQPVKPGEMSAKVYVTNFENEAQPLIRYEISDSITIDPEPCACGAGLPVVRVEGRADDTFYFADTHGAYSAHPPVPFEVLFLDLPGLAQYQLVHESQNRLRVRCVLEAGASADDVERRVQQRFGGYFEQRSLGTAVSVTTEVVPTLERAEQGHKLRQMVSRVPVPAF